jgi:hypothetical protein
MRSAECSRHVRGKSELAGKVVRQIGFNRDKICAGAWISRQKCGFAGGRKPPKFRIRTARDHHHHCHHHQFGMPDLTRPDLTSLDYLILLMLFHPLHESHHAVLETDGINSSNSTLLKSFSAPSWSIHWSVSPPPSNV